MRPLVKPASAWLLAVDHDAHGGAKWIIQTKPSEIILHNTSKTFSFPTSNSSPNAMSHGCNHDKPLARNAPVSLADPLKTSRKNLPQRRARRASRRVARVIFGGHQAASSVGSGRAVSPRVNIDRGGGLSAGTNGAADGGEELDEGCCFGVGTRIWAANSACGSPHARAAADRATAKQRRT